MILYQTFNGKNQDVSVSLSNMWCETSNQSKVCLLLLFINTSIAILLTCASKYTQTFFLFSLTFSLKGLAKKLNTRTGYNMLMSLFEYDLRAYIENWKWNKWWTFFGKVLFSLPKSLKVAIFLHKAHGWAHGLKKLHDTARAAVVICMHNLCVQSICKQWNIWTSSAT